MGRIRREFKRISGNRDARLFVIACEGQKTEVHYFEDFVSKDFYYNPRAHVEILKRKKGGSSPMDVLKQIDDFMLEYNLNENDELWIVIDRDKQSWDTKMIRQVAQNCIKKGYNLAVSNPCFEVWLLLHVKKLTEYTKEEIQELYENRKISSRRTKLKDEIKKINGSFNPSNLDSSQFLPNVNLAIKQAELLDSNKKTRWPNYFGSRIYLLAKQLLS